MNTPNKITLARIFLIPLVVFFYLASFIPYGKLVAAIIFVIACCTDFIDGHVARSTGQVTDLGKFFDAIADKVLIAAAMILVVAVPVWRDGTTKVLQSIIKPQWVGVVCVTLILAREFIVSALRQIAAAKGRVLAAERSGKIKTIFQDVTFALYMFFAFFVTEIYKNTVAFNTANTVISFVCLGLLVVSTILTLYSGTSYIIKNRDVFKENKD